jgi:hypothetical protein
VLPDSFHPIIHRREPEAVSGQIKDLVLGLCLDASGELTSSGSQLPGRMMRLVGTLGAGAGAK